MIYDDARHDAPDIRVLWDRKSHARKPYNCDCCGEGIAKGERYQSIGILEDDDFRHHRTHVDAYQALSGCPTIRAREKAEAEAQFEADRQLFPEPPALT